MIPQFWPVIIGHFAIWVGLVSLQDGRGRRAASMGIVALMASFWSWIFLVEFLEKGRFDCTIGLWAKLFAIVALIVCGVRLEREKPRELQSGKTPDKSGQGSISDQHESPE
jgi:predicted membrane-bound spermidine synthase